MSLVDGADATSELQSLLYEGAEVTLPGGVTEVHGTVTVPARTILNVPAGATLLRPSEAATTTPMLRLAGNHATVQGDGLVQTECASPDGIISFGKTSGTALYMRARGLRLKGVKATGNAGVVFATPSAGAGTYACRASDMFVESVGVGVRMDPDANANECIGIDFYDLATYAYDLNSVSQPGVVGGFIHTSPGITAVRCRSVLYPSVYGLRGEPQGESREAEVDAATSEGEVRLNLNTSLGWVLASETTVLVNRGLTRAVNA